MKKRRFVVGVATTAFLGLVVAGCNGRPDPDFGADGVATAGPRLHDRLVDLAVQPDGKIVAVGASSDVWDGTADDQFSVARLDPDGSLDTSFAGDGTTTVDFPQFTNERATSVVVLPSGHILVGGIPLPGECVDGWLLALLTPDGELVADAGNQGNGTSVWHSADIDPDVRLAILSEMVVAPSGRVLIAGGNVVAGFGGALGPLFPDATFGGEGGQVGEEGGFLRLPDPPDAACQTVYDVATRATGDVLVASQGGLWAADSVGLGASSLVGNAIFSAVTVQPDGRIVASGGRSFLGPFVARFLPDGAPDTSFLGTYAGATNTGYQAGYAIDLAVQSDGRILALDMSRFSTEGSELRRINADGTLDTAFGTDGFITIPGDTTPGGFLHGPGQGGGLALQPDGKILAGGSLATGLDLDFWIGRFTA